MMRPREVGLYIGTASSTLGLDLTTTSQSHSFYSPQLHLLGLVAILQKCRLPNTQKALPSYRSVISSLSSRCNTASCIELGQKRVCAILHTALCFRLTAQQIYISLAPVRLNLFTKPARIFDYVVDAPLLN